MMGAQLEARAAAVVLPSRAECEDFLYAEAALLDQWRLEEWLALFTTDAVYQVPTAGSPDDVDPASSLFYVADDYARLQHRVRRLMKPDAHSEFPRSHVVRLISNVRVLGPGDRGARVGCTFLAVRSKNGVSQQYFGHQRYELVGAGAAMRIAAKRIHLDSENLRPQGRVSILL